MHLKVLLIFIVCCAAIETLFGPENKEICWGIYSKDYLKSNKVSEISLLLNSISKDHELVSYIIFEYNDFDYIGHKFKDGNVKLLCDDIAVKAGICDKKHIGQYLYDSKGKLIKTGVISETSKPVKYLVDKTGYYCVRVDYINEDYIYFEGTVSTLHPFGFLSSRSLISLKFYEILAFLYVVLSLITGWFIYKTPNESKLWRQKLYSFFYILFCTFDAITSWSYYDLLNYTKNSRDFNTLLYMIFTVMINAIKVLMTIIGLTFLSANKTPKSSPVEISPEIKNHMVFTFVSVLASAMLCSGIGYLQVTNSKDEFFPWKYMIVVTMFSAFMIGCYLAIIRGFICCIRTINPISPNSKNLKAIFVILLVSPILLIASYITLLVIFYKKYGGNVAYGWSLSGWMVDIIPSTIFFVFCLVTIPSIITMKEYDIGYDSLDQSVDESLDEFDIDE